MWPLCPQRQRGGPAWAGPRIAYANGSRVRKCSRSLLPPLPSDAGRFRRAAPFVAWTGADCCAAQVVIHAGSAGEEIHVMSLRAQRDLGVVKQRYDFSCGAAALATLLTYGLGDAAGEDELLRALIQPLSPDQLTALQRNGLSLFDLQQLAQKRGHQAQGFRIHRDQLVNLSYPVIVFIKPHGYPHFAVFKGVRGDGVHLADPSLGNVRVPLYRFLDMWADKVRPGRDLRGREGGRELARPICTAACCRRRSPVGSVERSENARDWQAVSADDPKKVMV